ncbi:hypothetical protein TNCV_4656461 [Trichonephila clavipes]|nr:hypothetical protein TNCV_4656461 [Trichonephila clavipes]
MKNPAVSSDIQNSDMEIVKKPVGIDSNRAPSDPNTSTLSITPRRSYRYKPLQTPDPGVGKEIEEIPFSAEDREREEILAEQSCRNLRDRSILKMPAKFDNFVLLAEHIEPDTYKEAIAFLKIDKESEAVYGSGKDEIAQFVKKCPGVKGLRSLGSEESGDKGREFRTASICAINVVNSSKFMIADFATLNKMRFMDLMFASYNPPKWREAGGMKFHSIPSSALNSVGLANFVPFIKNVSCSLEVRCIVTPNDGWLGSPCYKSSETC